MYGTESAGVVAGQYSMLEDRRARSRVQWGGMPVFLCLVSCGTSMYIDMSQLAVGAWWNQPSAKTGEGMGALQLWATNFTTLPNDIYRLGRKKSYRLPTPGAPNFS